MRNMKLLFAASAVSLMSGAAFAADLPYPQPVPVPVEFGGWYLRGDIGFSNQQVKDVHYGNEALYATQTSFNQQSSFSSAGIFDLGVGYQFNNWLRADLIGQYRGSSTLNATDRFISGGAPGIDNYNGSKSEWLVMANGYVDLGTWWCVTPFIGAGVGTARVQTGGFTDTGVFAGNSPSFASAPGASRWNFAWAAHAGLAYKVSPSLTLELAYTYLDMGDGQTGVLTTFDGTTTNNHFTFKDLTSHDLTVGLRWAIDPMPAYAPPLITKG